VEKTFKKALSLDRSRIQLSRISKFGMLELSRQKKQPTIQEISFSTCPYCKGRGVRPSLESTALAAYRRIQTQAVKGLSAVLKVSLPHEIADYLQNQKRSELLKLENLYDMDILIAGSPDMAWDMLHVESVGRPAAPKPETAPEPESDGEMEAEIDLPEEPEEQEAPEAPAEAPKAKSRRRRKPAKAGVAAKGKKKITEAAEAAATPGPAPEPVEPPAEVPEAGEAVEAAPGQEPPKKKSRRRPRRRRKSGSRATAPGDASTEGEATAAGEAAPPAREPLFEDEDEDDSFGGFFSPSRR
jgi:ribonuclease E